MSNKSSNSSPSTKLSFHDFITQFMEHANAIGKHTYDVRSLAENSRLEKRRIQDFMNVLTACGMCVRHDKDTFRWETNEFNLKNIAYQYEIRATHSEISSVLIMSSSPTIVELTHTFLGYYTFLNVTTLNIRELAYRVCCNPINVQITLRRLYVVSFILESIGIISRTTSPGKYKLRNDINVYDITKEVISDLMKQNKYPEGTIISQFSRLPDSALASILVDRNKVITDFSETRKLRLESEEESN